MGPAERVVEVTALFFISLWFTSYFLLRHFRKKSSIKSLTPWIKAAKAKTWNTTLLKNTKRPNAQNWMLKGNKLLSPKDILNIMNWVHCRLQPVFTITYGTLPSFLYVMYVVFCDCFYCALYCSSGFHSHSFEAFKASATKHRPLL